MEDPLLVAKVTAAVRAADELFESVGGSSRHWVRECFLPALQEAGLAVVAAPVKPEAQKEAEHGR